MLHGLCHIALHVWLDRLDHCRAEGAHHELAQPVIGWRVHVQQPSLGSGQHIRQLFALFRGEVGHTSFGKAARGQRQATLIAFRDLAVAGDNPGAVDVAPEDWIGRTKFVELFQ